MLVVGRILIIVFSVRECLVFTVEHFLSVVRFNYFADFICYIVYRIIYIK